MSSTLTAFLLSGLAASALAQTPQIAIDPSAGGTQPFLVTGAATDPQSTSGPGIDLLEVWADGPGGSPSVRIDDVAWGLACAEFAGTPFHLSGWSARIAGLPDGTYAIRVVARASGSQATHSTSVQVAVARDVRFLLEPPNPRWTGRIRPRRLRSIPRRSRWPKGR